MAVMQILLGHRMWALVLHPTQTLSRRRYQRFPYEQYLANEVSDCSGFYASIHSFIYSFIRSFIKQSLQAGWARCVSTQGNQREEAGLQVKRA